jgi:hypothetical protein
VSFIHKHRLFIILSLILIIIDGVFVMLSYTQAKHNLHQEEYKLAQDYFSALDIAFQIHSFPEKIGDRQLATTEKSDILLPLSTRLAQNLMLMLPSC